MSPSLIALSPVIALIDTHCHLEMDEFDTDREEVIKRAKDAGIEAIITIGSDLEGSKGAVELSERLDFIYATIGIHPHDAKDFSEEIYNQIKKWAKGGVEGVKSLLLVKSALIITMIILHVKFRRKSLNDN